jgi:hypothetical protein
MNLFKMNVCCFAGRLQLHKHDRCGSCLWCNEGLELCPLHSIDSNISFLLHQVVVARKFAQLDQQVSSSLCTVN